MGSYWTQNVCFDFLYNFYLKHFSSKKNSARSHHKCMHIGLHVKYLLFLADFNETWNFPTYWNTMLRGRRTGMRKLIVTVCSEIRNIYIYIYIYIYILCWQNVEFVNVKLVVHIVYSNHWALNGYVLSRVTYVRLSTNGCPSPHHSAQGRSQGRQLPLSPCWGRESSDAPSSPWRATGTSTSAVQPLLPERSSGTRYHPAQARSRTVPRKHLCW